MTALYIVLGVLALVLVAIGLSYNRFVSEQNLIRESWSDVDAELRRRYDLIPNLVQTVKGYAAHEREIFEHVAELRAAAIAQTGAPESQASAENALVGGVRQLLAVAERYPDLRAAESFLSLQNELANTEDRIQAARRFYNGNVRDFNRRVQSFPSNLIGRSFGFRAAHYFEISEAVRATPETGFPP